MKTKTKNIEVSEELDKLVEKALKDVLIPLDALEEGYSFHAFVCVPIKGGDGTIMHNQLLNRNTGVVSFTADAYGLKTMISAIARSAGVSPIKLLADILVRLANE